MTTTEAPRLELPGERHEPHVDPQRATSLIYGYEGVGKSTYAVGRDPDHTLLLACGQPYDHLDAYPMAVADWTAFRSIGAEIVQRKADGDDQFQHFVVDIVDELYRMCFDHMCGQLGIVHPGLVDDYGMSWGAINDEFKLRVGRLATLGGVTFISHAQDIEVTAKVGKTTKTVPTFGGKPGAWLAAFVDFEFYAVVEADDDGNETRVLRTEPSARWSAKQRVPHGAAHLPDPLPLDAQAVAKVMVEAFAPKKKRATKKTLERAHEAMKTTVQPGAQTLEERIEELADSDEAQRIGHDQMKAAADFIKSTNTDDPDEAQRLLDAAKARLEEVTDKEKT